MAPPENLAVTIKAAAFLLFFGWFTQAELTQECLNTTFNYGRHCRFMSVSYMLW